MRQTKEQKAAQTALETQVKDAQPKPAAAFIDEEMTLRQMFATFGVALPSWKRTLIAVVLSIAAGAAIGSVSSVFLDILLVGAMSVTGSMFLATCLYVIGLIISMVIAWRVGKRILGYVLSGNIDRDASIAKDKVMGFFKSEPKEIVAA